MGGGPGLGGPVTPTVRHNVLLSNGHWFTVKTTPQRGDTTVRITKNQTTNRTLADLYRGMHRQHVVTITHLKAGETEPTIRTIEIHELRTTADGSIVIIAMCRLRQAERRFHVSDVLAYTLHKIGFVL